VRIFDHATAAVPRRAATLASILLVALLVIPVSAVANSDPTVAEFVIADCG
jgi:hypothetical protein